jgi:hypothetical protein
MVKVARSGAPVWLLLVGLTTVPPAGAGAVNGTHNVSPSSADAGSMVTCSDAMAGADGTTNVASSSATRR